ncbi:MAG: hypothetical protein L0Z50_42185, partial [Verrucomicrobiales bacterium]|nr:hypothetical protein [Verrucomicrobiales bacterium]
MRPFGEHRQDLTGGDTISTLVACSPTFRPSGRDELRLGVMRHGTTNYTSRQNWPGRQGCNSSFCRLDS